MSELLGSERLAVAKESVREPGLVQSLLQKECRIWHVSPPIAGTLWLLPLLVAVIVILALIDRPFYRFITKEDGPLEWSQFSGFVIAGVFALGLASIFVRSRRMLPFVLYFLLGLGCLFIAGEEISWAQRLLGVDTPANLAEVNLQGETNVHNVSGVHPFFRTMYLLIGFSGSVGAALIRMLLHHRHIAAPFLLDIVIPPLFLSSGFVVLFGYRLLRLVIFEEPRFVAVKYGEVAEFGLAFSLAAFSILSYRRWGSARVTER